MKQKTIKELKNLLLTGCFNKTLINELKKDKRKGVQQLIATYERNQQKEEDLMQQFLDMSHYEIESYQQGKKHVAGIDEAGRGPLAGPVVAAAVILPEDFYLPGLTDSKQLSQKQRHDFYYKITESAISYYVSVIDNQEVDQINIFEATKKAMYEAIGKLKPQPDHILIDAVSLNRLPSTSEVIVKGDQKSISIAAASVLAKVTRDRLMHDIHEKYPMYDFHSNMGYGTKKHLEMLTKHGVTPYHRRSFAPVRKAMK